jgi:hypothetical protein
VASRGRLGERRVVTSTERAEEHRPACAPSQAVKAAGFRRLTVTRQQLRAVRERYLERYFTAAVVQAVVALPDQPLFRRVTRHPRGVA